MMISDVMLMSEPGRYFSSGGMILVTRIVARRIHNLDYKSEEHVAQLSRQISSRRKSSAENEKQNETSERALIESAENIYYINDGIYGTFNAIVFDHKVFLVHFLTMNENQNKAQQYKSVIFGPTCDSIDCIAHAIDLPLLEIGDVLWFPDVGSYTNASASNFNGFQTKKYVFIWKN